MNRIEAINAMLDGNTIRTGSRETLIIIGGRVKYWDDCDDNWTNCECDSFLSANTGYELYKQPKPEDTIRLIINSKTYKAVRDKESSDDE